ncbi:HAD-IB family hydrolase [Chitinophaga varians]|uniref:HAD-IB family hydrolase n=1 Tax=Chitinophaga varians TaxID=2202339 RepID=UPI00165FF528|nr:HAD family hydrolase [Chitinophaga varians]
MTGIAFFDFDGTITRKDTMWEIIRFQKGSAALYTGLLRLAPGLASFKLGRQTAQESKEQVLRHFFGGMPAEQFTENCQRFCRERLPLLIREQAVAAIRKHQQEGRQVVVVTASARDWVAPWCETLGINCIASGLEVQHGLITGRLSGVNCNGQEKVVRIREQFNLHDYTDIYAYGDTNGDRPMLALAQHPIYKPFR